nr:345_t:CDS:2 [Entrophospora candida]
MTAPTALFQDKTLQLIGKPLINTDKLPEDIKRRVNALRYYQDKHEKLEAKFQEQILALEKQYLKEYMPLYEMRANIVQGKSEPTQDIVEEEKKETAEVDGGGPAKGIPGFWLTAMKNLVSVAEIITVRDEEALKHLIDIKMSYLAKPGFELTFEFEKNPFFTNESLKKTYFYREEPGYGGDFVYDHAEGTKIDWNEGKNLTKTVKKKVQKRKGTTKTRVRKVTVDTDSFFLFFSPPIEPEDEEDEQLDEQLEMDYQIGEDIKEKLVPRAIDC